MENNNLTNNLRDLDSRLKVKEAEEKKIQEQLNRLEIDKNSFQDKNSNLNEDKTNLQGEISSLETKNKRLEKDVEEKLNKYETLSEQYTNKIHVLEQIELDKVKEYHLKLKSTWNQHEDRVKGSVIAISERLGITYVPTSKFEFSGRPDNSVLIADEYVIFDAKSPGNPEELHNFQTYLKLQAEGVKKYAKHSGVKKDIYLVVPENTLKELNQFYYEEIDYRVHVITVQNLETVLRSLFKIEEYKTITEINPEDRENLCRVIGKLLHVSKRRIQVDAFFGTVLNEILKDSQKLIPAEMQTKINEYEASDKYNPKLENKNKTIPVSEVDAAVKELQTVAFGQELNTDNRDFEKIESIPLKNKYLEGKL